LRLARLNSRWHARWRGGGAAGMRTARHGKPARLGPAELAKVRRVLDRGAVAAGFDKAMRWSLQRPARNAIERDDAEIARWVAQEWPRIAQTPERAEPGSASSTSRASS
jgi:hypothetical protein